MSKAHTLPVNQNKLNNLTWRCIKFLDGNPPGSKILDRGGNPFASWLRMSYKDKTLLIKFRVQNSPYSNGSSYVLVKIGNKKVFEAKGNFIARTYNMKANIYIPGKWENRIPKVSD